MSRNGSPRRLPARGALAVQSRPGGGWPSKTGHAALTATAVRARTSARTPTASATRVAARRTTGKGGPPPLRPGRWPWRPRTPRLSERTAAGSARRRSLAARASTAAIDPARAALPRR
eukprot:12764928-Alexandrium_andersonii.AAC.1